MNNPTTDLLAELRSTVAPDRVVTEGPEYETGRQLFLAPTRARPAVIVRCTSTADVQAAVRAARRHGIGLVVRSGGHDLFGRSVRDGALVVDLGRMRSIDINDETRVAEVGAGALSADLVTAAEQHDLTAVTGTAGTVGIAGLTIGGGYGPLIGRFGLAADNLLGAEVVLADGTVVDTDAEPDLLWALRGGGGNFGVVTSLRVRLHPVPSVLAGNILFPLSEAETVLRRLDGVLRTSPDELEVDTAFLVGPDGNAVLALMPTWSGDLAAGARPGSPVNSLRELGTPLVGDIATAPRSRLLAGVDQMFPFSERSGIFRTRTVSGFTPGVIQALVRAAETITSPHSALMAHQFHGAATRTPLASTAFGLRSPHLMVEIIGMWETDDARADDHIAWTAATSTALRPHSLPGGYVNLLGPDDRDQAEDAYGANTARLLSVKSRFDPQHAFEATPLPSAAAADRRGTSGHRT
ncbi:FAD-binding oxidoreductase [Microlunatus soli]|uniref:FAD/FMN-containing dehydrogenase n=1 Tax=Microlunatus soli TaxID=630515 RepID=A0A1H1ZU84_9ACTN|nr:FAD-binding oxidoreductase [Microlunatus soli]SDT37274.1 FAD/FMN-containing dehydrogenase [Microlunatus soli]